MIESTGNEQPYTLETAGNNSGLKSKHIKYAINLSLLINVGLAIAKIYAAYASGSMAVLSSLVDSILDLVSQALFWFTDKYMHKPSVNYPAGRLRLEPIAVIIMATLMGIGAMEVVQNSISVLIDGVDGSIPKLEMSTPIVSILVSTIVLKLILWFYCSYIGKRSPSVSALAQDHRNDVFSNTVAVATSLIAHEFPAYWYIDPCGAILISMYITITWFITGKEQVKRLVGLQASDEFIGQIKSMVNGHHPLMSSDIVRAYHFGNNFLVEVEVILPSEMCVREAHDISLNLQKRVEALEEVERAFVHVDYSPRDYDEHKDLTVRNPPSV